MPKTDIPRFKLALKIGWTYFRRFALDHKQDFEQTGALLALEAADLEEREAVKAFERGYKEAMGNYGYRYAKLDGTFRWLPASAVPILRVSHGRRKLVKCAGCSAWLTKQANQVRRKNRRRVFCSPDCYRANRRSESAVRAQSAKITLEAVQRFQQRVANLPPEQVIATIRAGIANPVKTVSQGLRVGVEIHCAVDSLAFRCRCRERAGRLEICTVLESKERNDEMRANRTARRECQAA